MALLVEYRLLDKLKVIREGTGTNKKLKVKGKFQKCDEQNNNGRTYPRKVLESQVTEIQGKINERSLVGALDHPPNDAIHLSQASHLITKLWVESNGDVMGEAEILSTPSGKIVEALLNDGVKIGISSRGLGTISELKNAKVVNEDFKLITFDLVSDPSTKGAFPELTEATKLNSQKAQTILTRMKNDKILLTVLEQKINESIREARRVKGSYTYTDIEKNPDIRSQKPKQINHSKANDAAKGKPKTEPAFKSNVKWVPSEKPKTENPALTAMRRWSSKPKQGKFNFMESELRVELTKLLREAIKAKKGGTPLFNNFNLSNNPKGKGRKAVDGHVTGKKPAKK